MKTPCIAREYGCSCLPGNCRSASTSLGRFNKSSDMRGVFSPKLADYLAMFAAFLVVLAVGLTVTTLREEARQHEIQARI